MARSIGTEVVEQVAAREGVDPLDLDEKLYDVIDADALDVLTADGKSDAIRIEFTYLGYLVSVDRDGVSVDELASGSDPEGAVRSDNASTER